MKSQDLLPASIKDHLPSMIRNEISKLSAQKQEEFIEEFKRKTKSIGAAYAFWLFGLHYAYLGKWGMLVAYFLTAGGFLIWVVVDAFRIPGMIRDLNKDIGTDIFRTMKAIGA